MIEANDENAQQPKVCICCICIRSSELKNGSCISQEKSAAFHELEMRSQVCDIEQINHRSSHRKKDAVAHAASLSQVPHFHRPPL